MQVEALTGKIDRADELDCVTISSDSSLMLTSSSWQEIFQAA